MISTTFASQIFPLTLKNFELKLLIKQDKL